MDILWWHWLVLGLLLVVAEMAASGGFYIIFFGISALIIGLLAAAGLVDSVAIQVLLFSVISVLGLLLFRARLLRVMQKTPQSPQIDTLVGEVGTASEDLSPGSVGRVELRGTLWSARNSAAVSIVRGARCRVVRVDGLTVLVEPEGARA